MPVVPLQLVGLSSFYVCNPSIDNGTGAASVYVAPLFIAGRLEQHLYLLFLYSWWIGAASISVVPLKLVDWNSIYICCSSTAGGVEQLLCPLLLNIWWT